MARAVFAPDSLDALRAAVSDAALGRTRLAIEGAGSKSGLGHAVAAEATLSLARLTGVTYYEPGELVMEALAGTPLAAIEAELAANNQRLAFEPGEVGHLWGGGGATIGGVFACNLSGPRRPFAGAARDHLLGVAAVSGRGEAFAAGGRVVKNVTGYDMGKLLAGSFGTLAVMGRVTFKVLPRPEAERTVLLLGQMPEAASAALNRVAGGTWDITGGAYVSRAVAARSDVSYIAKADAPVTAIRLEGTRGAVAERAAALRAELAALAPGEELHTHNSRAFWGELRDARLIAPPATADAMLWRLSVAPAQVAVALDFLPPVLGEDYVIDWAGGSIWAALTGAVPEATGNVVRAAADEADGHAVLWRAGDDIRATVPVFGDRAPALAALTRRIKSNFDPYGILNPGRMGPLGDGSA